MNITLRLLLGFFAIVGLAAWFVLNVFVEEVKPGVRQTMEDTLVDTAWLLAELAVSHSQNGQINTAEFSQAFTRYLTRQPQANIWGFEKKSLDLRVYITDAKGIVIYDSENLATGQDYSQWNDVYLTLQGRYGVRSSLQDPDNSRSSVMHVAAPIRDQQQQLIGVLTVAKPTLSVQPFIDRSIQRIEQAGWWLLGGSLLVGLVITFWLNYSISQLRTYAREVSLGRKTALPKTHSRELDELGRALAEMREKLDGREYVENYVHHLVHEMKSPLTAVLGSAELLNENMPAETRRSFIVTIQEQSTRLRDMLDKLLALAKVEHRQQLDKPQTIELHQLVAQVIQDQQIKLDLHQQHCLNQIPSGLTISGDVFLLRQAFNNLLDNAIDFSPAGGEIQFQAQQQAQQIQLCISDSGCGIPDYALPRIFERFYSLPRPDNRPKSTGLGLPFVREVIELHGGTLTLQNRPSGGVEVQIRFAG